MRMFIIQSVFELRIICRGGGGGGGGGVLVDSVKVNRQRPKFVMRRSELNITTLAKWLISPLVWVIIKICKEHLVQKTNSNINIYNET